MGTKYPDVKKGGAGWASFGKNTGSRHPKRQRAILWHRGSGTILIYKIDVWQVFDIGGRCLGVMSAMTPSTQKSQLGWRVSLLLTGFRKLQRRVPLTAESAESAFEPVHAKWWKSLGATLGEHLANPSAVHSRCWWRLNRSAT